MQYRADKLELELGRLSSGEVYCIDVCAFSALFLSYSSEEQLKELFDSFIKQLASKAYPILFFLSFSSHLSNHIALPERAHFTVFTHNTNEEIKNIDAFIRALMAAFKKRRQRRFKQNSNPKEPQMVVMIDDLFEVFRSPHKRTAKSFIKLLTEAAAVGIYFILGFTGIYRNLLQQIQSSGGQAPGGEIVINPDGLLFFRKNAEGEYYKLYPL